MQMQISNQSRNSIHDMTLEAYQALRHQNHLANTQRYLEMDRAALAICSKHAIQRRKNLERQIANSEQVLSHPQEQLEASKATYARTYKRAMLEALRADVIISQHLIDQDPDLVKAQTARDRYLKARATSFDNLKNAVVFDTQAGYKVKLQSGKPVEQHHLDEVAMGIAEIEHGLAALGLGQRLRDVCRSVGLTVAHTDGKHPFLRARAGGLYTVNERCISIGTMIGGQPIKALAHEIGHMLAYEAGYALLGKQQSWVAYQFQIQGQCDGDFHQMLTKAYYALNDAPAVWTLFKGKTKCATPEGENEASRWRLRLGGYSYWREPDELWARLFEQRLSGLLTIPQVACEADYSGQMAYWPVGEFAAYVDAFDAALRQQFDILEAAMENVSIQPPLWPI